MTQNSFKTVQEALLFSFQEEVIDIEEFAALHDQYTPQNLPFRHWDCERFSLRNKDSAECKADFRFEKTDIPLLVDALHMPDTFICPNGTICDATEGVCVMLRRFAYPCRLSDMIPIFGRSVPELSMISNEVTEWMYKVHGHRISEWNHFIMSPDQLQTYSEAIHDKGAALDNCFGFVDGTVRPISKPGVNQRAVYNGHKRVHALKFQSVALPNGLIGHLFGPVGEIYLIYALSIVVFYHSCFCFRKTKTKQQKLKIKRFLLYKDYLTLVEIHLFWPS